MDGSHGHSADDSGQEPADAGSGIRSANPLVKSPVHEMWMGSDAAALNLTGRKFVVFENPTPSWDSPHGVVWEVAGWRRTMAQRVVFREVTAHVD